MKKKDVFLFGAGGHSLVVRDIVEAAGSRVVALVDDAKVGEYFGLPIKPLSELLGLPAIVTIGNAVARYHVVEMLMSQGFVFSAAKVHPVAVISPSVAIGHGSVVMAGVVINAQATVGQHCIVNTGASIGHECSIGDFVHIAPHSTLCGNVSVGDGSWIGAGATVVQGVTIGKWCMIGAGAVVTKDIPDGSLAYGNNCKVMKKINEEILHNYAKNGGGEYSTPRNRSDSALCLPALRINQNRYGK